MNRTPPSAAWVAAFALGALALLQVANPLLSTAGLGLPRYASIGLVNPLLFLLLALAIGAAAARLRAGAVALAPAPALHRLACLALLLLPALHLTESLSGSNLGVDLLHPMQRVANPPPGAGRLSPNACIAFMLAALALWQLRRPPSRVGMRLYLFAISLVALIGGAGLAGYFLGLETLYQLPSFNRLLPPTAAGFVVAGIGLWSLHEANQRFEAADAPRRIRRRTRAVVLLLTLTAGVAGFALMRDTFEDQIAQDMARSTDTTALALAQELDDGLALPELLVTGTPLRRQLQALRRDPDDAAAQAALRTLAESLMHARLNGIAIIDAAGRHIAGAGAALGEAVAVRHTLHVGAIGDSAVLAWQGRYLLQLSHPLADEQDGTPLGWLQIEQPLPQFDRLLEAARQTNATSDAVVCGAAPEGAICAETRWRKPSFTLPKISPGAAGEAIGRALRGQHGVLNARDPRGQQVVAGYAPIGSFGLALGLKTDVDTLYAPLRARIAAFMAAMVALSMLAIWALRSQVQPVLARLADGERELKRILDDQQELVSLSTRDGTLCYVNPSYARHFGLTPAQMVGMNMYEHIDAPDRAGVRSQIAEVFDTGQTMRNENRLSHADGRSRWLSWTNSLQTTPDGTVLLHSVGRDVTERRAAVQALRDLTDVFDNTSDYVIQTDRLGQISYLNPAARAVVGLAPDADLSGRLFSDFNTDETNAQLASIIGPYVRAHGIWVGETTFLAHDGRTIPVSHMVIAHRDENGRISRYSGIMRDITEARAAQRAQQRQRATLRSVTEAIPANVAVIGSDRRVRFANRQLARWAGIEPELLPGRTIDHVLGDEAVHCAPLIERALRGETVHFSREDRRSGELRHLSTSYIPLFGNEGEVDGFVAVTQDVTQQKQEEIRLIRLSQRDPLTGALNRAGFEQFLEAVSHDHGAAPPIALLYVDLDHFKPVNDAHGHPAGDEVLRQFTARVQATIRPADALARLGGDEFAVVLVGLTDIEAARSVADKVLHAARTPFDIADGLVVQIGASIGIATPGEAGADWRELIRSADAQLYRAKSQGRGRAA